MLSAMYVNLSLSFCPKYYWVNHSILQRTKKDKNNFQQVYGHWILSDGRKWKYSPSLIHNDLDISMIWSYFFSTRRGKKNWDQIIKMHHHTIMLETKNKQSMKITMLKTSINQNKQQYILAALMLLFVSIICFSLIVRQWLS